MLALKSHRLKTTCKYSGWVQFQLELLGLNLLLNFFEIRYHWNVSLFGFPPDCQLSKDLQMYKKKIDIDKVYLDIVCQIKQSNTFNQLIFSQKEQKFPSSFPFDPPFIRVVKPRFAFHSGHVTVGLKFSEFLFFTKFFFGWLFSLFVKGGSICFELLTRSGWSPACTIESVLIQIRTEMVGKRFFFWNWTRINITSAENYQPMTNFAYFYLKSWRWSFRFHKFHRIHRRRSQAGFRKGCQTTQMDVSELLCLNCSVDVKDW